MKSNRSLLFFIFGISLLPKIYSDTFPSLFITKKPNTRYIIADEFQYIAGQNDFIKFSTSPGYLLYNACPEGGAPNRRADALKVQASVADFEAKPLDKFIQGDFAEYNCRKPIRPIVLKSKEQFPNKYTAKFDIGFLIHEKNAGYGKLWEQYNSLPEVRDYYFLRFLTIMMDRQSGTIISVLHLIINKGLPKLDSALDPLPPNEKNTDEYRFNVNSLYTKENQKMMFSLIFGEAHTRYYDHQEDRYLIKVQLAPYEDFPLNTWKLPSFMDLNTAMMWKQLYLQWRRIEIFVRNVARDLEPLIVATGTAKILTLTDTSDKSQSVYLRKGRKSPVPQYFWKHITFIPSDDNMSTQAVLIVMHNDPYTTDQKPICEDLGGSLGWMVSNKDYTTGLTYVCPFKDNIATQLHEEFAVNYETLNLNNMLKSKHDENDIFPSLFIIKKQDKFYTVADEFDYIEGHDNMLKFSISSEYQLYNACPEENAPFLPTYTLKLQQLVTDFQASWEEFVKGDFVKFNCQNPIKPTVLKSKEKFNDESVLEYDIGFLIHDNDANFDKLLEKYENFTEIQEYVFLRFLTVRMNQKSGAIIEVCHQIISRGLLEPDSAYSGPSQPSENNVDIFGFDVNSLYTEENQTKIFSSIFSERHSLYYSYPNQILRKVQLAPHEDFQLNTWKLSSFIDLNTTAMWEQLYAQWRRIEVFVREVALELETLSIATGTAKILTLADANDQQQPVYLREEQKSPVFQYIWKLIKFEQLDDSYYTQAILIVMHNDPYTPNQKPICEDVSENWGWMVSNKDYKTGLTYGCPVKESITSELHHEYKENYASLNLNYVQKLEYDENDTFPSLFIIKNTNNVYAVADKFEYVEGQDNALKFSTSPEHQLYNACPEEKAHFHQTYTMKVQKLVADFEASPLQQFVKGDFIKFNCRYPIKPIVLKSNLKFKDKFAMQYDIGFLIHHNDAICNKLLEKYENLTEIQEYEFLHFLDITMNRQSKTILSVLHRIVGRGLLEPESSYLGPFQANEKNFDVYEFDVNSLYAEENQQKMFSSIFGQFSSHYYNHSDRFLLKVQLAPHEDFFLDTWKLPSFMDLNTTAMWKQLHSQWRKVEIFVRKVARELGALTVETGAAKILSLTDGNQQKQQVYLRKKRKSPVAKYIWKLVKYDQLNDDAYTQAILIVMHNDPYTTDQKLICDDVSENLGWMVSNKDYKTGLTYVCPVVQNVTSELHEEYNVNYDVLNLNNVHEWDYDENGPFKMFFNNIYAKVVSCS